MGAAPKTSKSLGSRFNPQTPKTHDLRLINQLELITTTFNNKFSLASELI
jgi:hypothetical protein